MFPGAVIQQTTAKYTKTGLTGFEHKQNSRLLASNQRKPKITLQLSTFKMCNTSTLMNYESD